MPRLAPSKPRKRKPAPKTGYTITQAICIHSLTVGVGSTIERGWLLPINDARVVNHPTHFLGVVQLSLEEVCPRG